MTLELRAVRPARLVAVATAVLVAVTLLLHVAPAPAQATPGLLTNLNIERQRHGVAPVTRTPDLDRVAQAWSEHMARTGVLAHNPDFARQVTGWRSVAENVGYASSEWGVHVALMNSTPHRVNILNRAFSQVGIGVAWAGSRVYVTQVFRQPTNPAPAGAFYAAGHDPAIFWVTPYGRHHASYQEWAAAGFPAPRPTPTEYVRYPWSPHVYAVTYWGGAWQWDSVDYAGWQRAGFPGVRVAGWVGGSSLFKRSGNPAIYLRDPHGGVRHLTPAEWAATGYRTPSAG